MGNNFNDSVGKIVNNYLDRIKAHLKGLPEADQKELVKEVYSHIYESFMNDPTENEIDRIFNVINKLGEPADVVSSKISTSMVSLGKKKKLPLYILTGILIGLFGIPLGLSGVSILLAIVITIGALVFSYYVIAFSLLISGWIGAIASVIRIIDADFLADHILVFTLIPDHRLAGLLGLLVSMLVAALGFGMLILGKHIMRGVRFLFNTMLEKIRAFRLRRKE